MIGTNDAVAVRAVIDERHDAVRWGDAAAAVAPLAADVIVYDLQPPLAFAGEAARDTTGLDEWLATWSALPRIALTNPVLTIDGDLAVAHGLSHMTGTKQDGEAVDLWYRSTIVLRRAGDTWRIVHEHHSVPFLMDGSFKAAIDLHP